jgi:hypothetical protein
MLVEFFFDNGRFITTIYIAVKLQLLQTEKKSHLKSSKKDVSKTKEAQPQITLPSMLGKNIHRRNIEQ